MFHWICPECGREIAPNLRQCPACEPETSPAEPALAEPKPEVPQPVEVALATAPDPIEFVTPVEVVAAPPGPPPLPVEPAAVEGPAVQAVAVEPTVAEAAAVEPPPPPLAAPIQGALLEPVIAAPPAVESAPPVPELVQLSLALPIDGSVPLEIPPAEPGVNPELVTENPESLPDPLLTLAESVRAEQDAAPPVVESPVTIQLAPVVEPEPPVAPPVEVAQAAAAESAAEPPAVSPESAEVAPVAPVARLPLLPELPLAIAAPAEPIALLAAPAAEIAAVELIPEVVAPAPLNETVSPLSRPKPRPPAANLPAVDVVPQPALAQTHCPLSSGPAPALPVGSMLDCASVLARSIRPARPDAKPYKPDTSPRMTLPGPTLPPALETFSGAGLVAVSAVETGKAKTKASGWLVSVTVMLVLLFMGVAAVSSFTPQTAADTKSVPVAAEPAPVSAVPVSAHPLAKSIEVTGFRIVVDFNRKSEIHYLLVNHSPVELDDVTVFVTLRAASAKPGQPPLCRFSFRASGIGAFESKEMISPIEKPTRSVALPEWQDLRADVQVGQ